MSASLTDRLPRLLTGDYPNEIHELRYMLCLVLEDMGHDRPEGQSFPAFFRRIDEETFNEALKQARREIHVRSVEERYFTPTSGQYIRDPTARREFARSLARYEPYIRQINQMARRLNETRDPDVFRATFNRLYDALGVRGGARLFDAPNGQSRPPEANRPSLINQRRAIRPAAR